MEKFDTIREAAEHWVREFNAIPLSMIEQLAQDRWDEWDEVTLPSVGDRVCVYSEGYVKFEGEESTSDEGEIVGYNADDDTYLVRFDDGVRGVVEADGFEVTRDDYLPMWGMLWQFKDPCDDWWLEEKDGLRVMSDCGFRIYHHDEWGFFFGIDGAGYGFYEAHWIPLYKARGLQWHKCQCDDGSQDGDV